MKGRVKIVIASVAITWMPTNRSHTCWGMPDTRKCHGGLYFPVGSVSAMGVLTSTSGASAKRCISPRIPSACAERSLA